MRDAFKRLVCIFIVFFYFILSLFRMSKKPFPLKKGDFEFTYLINQSFILMKNDTKERSEFLDFTACYLYNF